MRTTVETGKLASEPRFYRMRRIYVFLGAAFILLYSGMAIGSSVVAYRNLDGSFPRPKLFAIILGVIWSGWVLFSSWLTLAAVRTRVVLGNRRINTRGAIRQVDINYHEITRIDWRTWPVGGSLVILAGSKKTRIQFNSFTHAEREEIIAHFERTFSDNLHHNRDRFKIYRVQLVRQANQVATLSRTGVMRCVTPILLAGIGTFFLYTWYLGIGGIFLVLSIVSFAFAMLATWWLLRSNAGPKPLAASQVEPTSRNEPLA